jgi:hypothetical protein
LQEQLDEIRARTAILDAESVQGRNIHEGHKKKMKFLEADIAALREQAEERRRQQEEAERSSATEVVFRRRDPTSLTPIEALDVSALEKWSKKILCSVPDHQGMRKRTLTLPRR